MRWRASCTSGARPSWRAGRRRDPRRPACAGDSRSGLIGSAFKAGAVFVEPLTRAIHACAPRARVSVVEMAPVGGSLLLAARACGDGDASARRSCRRSSTRLCPTELRASISARPPIAPAPDPRCAPRRPRWRRRRRPTGSALAERDEERRREHVAGAEVVDGPLERGDVQLERLAAGCEDGVRAGPRRDRHHRAGRRRTGDQARAARALVLADTIASHRAATAAAAPAGGACVIRPPGSLHSRTSPWGVSPTNAAWPRQRPGVSRATGARCRIAVSSARSSAIGPAHASTRWLRSAPGRTCAASSCGAPGGPSAELAAVGLEQLVDLAGTPA